MVIWDLQLSVGLMKRLKMRYMKKKTFDRKKGSVVQTLIRAGYRCQLILFTYVISCQLL